MIAVVACYACYAGDVVEGGRVLRPMRGFGSPVLDLFAPKPFLAHQQMFDPSFRHGCWYYFRSCDVAVLTDEVIGVMAEHGRRISSPITSLALWQMGGAVARVADDATAFCRTGPLPAPGTTAPAETGKRRRLHVRGDDRRPSSGVTRGESTRALPEE